MSISKGTSKALKYKALFELQFQVDLLPDLMCRCVPFTDDLSPHDIPLLTVSRFVLFLPDGLLVPHRTACPLVRPKHSFWSSTCRC